MTTTESHLAYETDGSAVAGAGRTGPVYNPGTGAQIGDLPFADAEAVGGAVATAKAAAKGWGGTSLSARAEIMFQIRAALREHRDELAGLIVMENGKTAADAVGEVGRGLESVEFACGIPQLLQGIHSSNVATDVDVHSARYPIGVVGAITPFNFH